MKVKKGTTGSWLLKEIKGTRSGAHLLSLKPTMVTVLEELLSRGDGDGN